MLLLKKVTSNSDIESLQIPFAEQNIYLLAQDASGRQIFGRQTVRGTKNWPNSFFITPLEFNATLLPDIQRHGQPQTATVELTLKFNMLGNAVGMYDWMLQTASRHWRKRIYHRNYSRMRTASAASLNAISPKQTTAI